MNWLLHHSSSTAVQVSFAQQNYTITEDGVVNITLVTSTSDYEFDFYVILQYMDGTATGESCTVAYNVLHSSSFQTYSMLASRYSEQYLSCNYPEIPSLPSAGSDYTPDPYHVSFSAGQPYAILMVSPIDDNTAELSEYFTLMITSVDRPDVVEIGSPNTSVITIVDDEPRMSATFCDVAENAFIHNTTLYM